MQCACCLQTTLNEAVWQTVVKKSPRTMNTRLVNGTVWAGKAKLAQKVHQHTISKIDSSCKVFGERGRVADCQTV